MPADLVFLLGPWTLGSVPPAYSVAIAGPHPTISPTSLLAGSLDAAVPLGATVGGGSALLPKQSKGVALGVKPHILGVLL